MAWARGDEASALTAWHASLPQIAAGFRFAASAGRDDWAVDYLTHTAPYLGLTGRAELVAEWKAAFETLSIADRSQRAWGLQSLAEAYLCLNQPAAAVPLLEAAQAACANEEGERLWFQATLTLGQALVAADRTAELATLASASRETKSPGNDRNVQLCLSVSALRAFHGVCYTCHQAIPCMKQRPQPIESAVGV